MGVVSTIIRAMKKYDSYMISISTENHSYHVGYNTVTSKYMLVDAKKIQPALFSKDKASEYSKDLLTKSGRIWDDLKEDLSGDFNVSYFKFD